MSEGSLVGTSFPIEGAVDRDGGHFSVNLYRVVPETAPFSVQFQKNVDGSSLVRLILKKTLDREQQKSYQFQVNKCHYRRHFITSSVIFISLY